MEMGDLISIQEFCKYYNIHISFLNSLNEFELVEIITTQNVQYIHKMHIKNIEKMIRLHYELDINMEGMDVIYKLLNRVELLQNEITELQNKLSFYDNN